MTRFVAVPRRAPAGDVRRGAPGARARARPRARRLGDDRHRARGDRGARARHRPDAAGARRRARRVHQVGLPYHWGSRGLTTGGSANDLIAHGARPERPHPGGRRRSRATSGPAGGRAARRCRSSSRASASARGQREMSRGGDVRRRGEAARRLLHRHVGLHRLQGVRGRVQGVEPHPRGRPRLDRRVLRQHVDARREHVAPRRVRRAAQAAAARRRRPPTTSTREPLRWLMASDVCKHCTHAALPRRLPDRRALPHRVRHRRRAGGRLQRLRLLRARVPVRRARQARPAAHAGRRAARAAAARHEGGRPRLEVHALLRPAQGRPRAGVREGVPDRLDPVRRARRAARARATQRLDEAAGARAGTARSSTARDPDDGVGGFGAFFLLLDEPEVYGLPPDPVVTTRDLPAMWRTTALAAAALVVGVGARVPRRPAVSVTERGTRCGRTTAGRSSRSRSGSREIPFYFFTGGLAGGVARCCTGVARLAGNERLAKTRALRRRGGRRRLARRCSSPTSAGPSAS